MKNDYLHPVLLEIADKFECSFWKPIFENLLPMVRRRWAVTSTRLDF